MPDTLIVEPSKAGHNSADRKEYADEQLFARLIGAAVLLALAVIVLPFVLDGSGSQREYEYAETLPPEPQRPVVEKSFSSRQQIEPAPSVDTTSVRIPDTTALTQFQVPDPVPVEAPASFTPPQPANQLDNAGNSALETVPLQTGWSIQVASFVRDENAVKLVEKMRAQNLPVYANRVQGKNRPVIRVLAGPFDNQVEALALQNRIDTAYRVESLIVRRK